MYFKKKRMYKLAVELLPSDMVNEPLPTMRDCEYKFYRGTEWLYLFFGDMEYKLCHNQAYVSVELVDFESNELKYRKMYNYNDFEYLLGVMSNE